MSTGLFESFDYVAADLWHPDKRDRALFEGGTCVPLAPDQIGASGTFIMEDDVNASLLDPNVHAAAYYGNGPFANLNSVEARVSSATILAPTMLRPFTGDLKTIKYWEHGVSWDSEPSLFTAAQAGGLVKMTRAQGVFPHLYCPLSWAAAVCQSIHDAGFTYEDFGLHTAHWTFVPHICSGIQTVFGSVTAKSTQFTDRYEGRSLDASLCQADYLGPFGSKPKPKPAGHPTGKMNAAVTIDWDKPPGHRGSIRGTSGTWKSAPGQPLEVFQISADSHGIWRIAPVANTTPPLGGKPNPKPPPPKPAAGHNPLPGATGTRIDQGGDYNMSTSGFVAPYTVKVIKRIDQSPGWGGGSWNVFEIIEEGDFKGQGFYVAEGALAIVNEGDVVAAGKQLCKQAPNPFFNPPLLGNIEAGWVAPNADQPLAQVLAGYPHGQSGADQSEQAITAGSAWDKFVTGLGGPTCHNNTNLQPNWSLLPSALRKALGA